MVKKPIFCTSSSADRQLHQQQLPNPFLTRVTQPDIDFALVHNNQVTTVLYLHCKFRWATQLAQF